MGSSGFNRQWSRHAEQAWHNHRQGWHGGGWDGGPPWTGRGRSGPPPWVAGLFGLASGDQQRGPRVRRGDVRSAILHVLAGSPDSSGESLNGYQVITQIAERSQGGWKPSPGSVYPTISQLEDEGLVQSDEAGGRRTVRLTDAGWDYVRNHEDELDKVWEPFTEDAGRRRESPDYAQLKPELGQVMSAVWQIVTQGSEQQRVDAIEVLVETRRKLYGILAEGDA